MEMNSSNMVTTGALSQKSPDRNRHFIVRYSETMNSTEWEIHDIELLAVFNA